MASIKLYNLICTFLGLIPLQTNSVPQIFTSNIKYHFNIVYIYIIYTKHTYIIIQYLSQVYFVYIKDRVSVAFYYTDSYNSVGKRAFVNYRTAKQVNVLYLFYWNVYIAFNIIKCVLFLRGNI